MRYAIIENNIVTNIIEADSPLPGIEMVNAADAQIGSVWDSSTFTAPAPTPDQHNAPILAALAAIDAKTIRPLREGDTTRVAALEAQAAALRAQLMKP